VSGWAQSPSTDDLQKKIDDLSQQLAEVKAKLAAMQPAAPAPAQANAVVATPATSPAPASPTLGSILGPTTLSGFVDAYYGYNSNHPASLVNGTQPFTPFNNQFGLNMIELVMTKSPSTDNRTGYNVALGFGQAMNAVNGSEPRAGLGFAQYLKEAYFSYLAPVGKGLQIDVGKFVTPAGAEVIESNANWNYSRSVLFYYAIPYFHYGARAKYAFNDKVSLTGYLVNGWNNSSETNPVNGNSGKTTGFSAAFTPSSKFSFIENYLVGPEAFSDNSNYRHLSDTVITFNPTAKLSLMANFDYGHDRVGTDAKWWTGIAGYIKYAPNDKWAFATRGEWFNDHDGFETGTAQHLSEFTFTLQRMLAGKLMSRLEFRRDMSDENTFPYRDFAEGIDHQNTVTLGLVYAFSSADAK